VAALLLDQAGSFFCGVVSDRFHGLFHCHAGGAQYLATTGDVSFWWKSLEKVLREGKANNIPVMLKSYFSKMERVQCNQVSDLLLDPQWMVSFLEG
jgi:hypothetical protein